MTSQQDIPLYEEVVNHWDQWAEFISRSETSDLRKTRRQAFEKFRESGFPSIRNEDWKYTNITRWLRESYAMQGLPEEPSGNTLSVAGMSVSRGMWKKGKIPDLDCYTLFLHNGVWVRELGDEDLPPGIEVLKVSQARKDPALSAWFERADEKDRYFTALNTALFSDGLFIRVKAGTVPDKPLHIIHDFTSGRNLMVQPRHVWVVGENAELSVIETVVSDSGDAGIWINSLTEINLNRDARLDHVLIQTASAGARVVNHTTVRQKKQSLYNSYTFTLPGADLVRNDLQARLEEDHTETHLYGLYLTAGSQLVDNHTLVDHQKPSCFSNELYKGVLLEQSTGVFNGKVYVHRDAQKTNAFQQNNNLVIGRKATIDSKPELEIFADDVKCSHGSTVGQFSEDALFYLRARGIGEATAKALLITAFAFDVTEKLKIGAVAAYINQLISHHIPVDHA
ncbi:MAG TPA: Fe-S cluster assembly protein SufD [Puia sp.]|jgi:Fe-S cluster assembly protein SufD|nr:Fe-S cluster assembly protein SufD [Puia sp.]